MEFQISPSDLTFLYNGCPRCFYLKTRSKIKQPGIFPGVFNKIDSAMRKFFDGRNVQDFAPGLPSGIFRTRSETVTSAPIKFGKNSLIISGKTDAFVDFENTDKGIIDFKCAGKLDDMEEKYTRQLHGYAQCVGGVSHLGLIVFTPGAFFNTATTEGDALASLTGPLTWVPITRDDDAFLTFLGGVAKLLAGPLPAIGTRCDYCKYIGARKAEKDLFGE
jgi:hypothetical protein